MIRKNDELSPDTIIRPRDEFELIWSDSKLMDSFENKGIKVNLKHKSLNNIKRNKICKSNKLI